MIVCWLELMCILLLILIMHLIIPVGVLLSSESQPSQIHIFLSFRGTDTRESFASLLYDALILAGFNVFMDDQNIPIGNDINFVINDVIERSLGAAIILSKDFASSQSCLDELVLILGMKKMLGSSYVLVPIYVDGVQPYEVRKQRGSYAKAFAKHEKWYNHFWSSKQLKVWSDALTEIAGYRGRILKGKWSKFINEIVDEIRQEFCSLGITVNPRCCPYHRTRMDRMHAVLESLKMLAIIGNLIFLLHKFLSSPLIKQLCTQIIQLMATINKAANDKNLVVEKGLGISDNWDCAAVLILVLCIIFLAIRQGISNKKRPMAPEIVEREMGPSRSIVPETMVNEASKERVMTSRIKATVEKAFVNAMNKALSANLYGMISSMSSAM